MVVTLMICLPWFLSSYTLCSLLLSCSCFLSLLGLSGMPVSLYLDQDLWSWAMLILLFWVFLFSMATDLRSVPNKLGGVIGLLLSVLVLVFMVASPTSMYIAFESSLLPMTLAVLGLGAQPERLSGSLYLWIYTIAASVPYFMIVLNSWSLWLFFLHGDIGTGGD